MVVIYTNYLTLSQNQFPGNGKYRLRTGLRTTNLLKKRRTRRRSLRSTNSTPGSSLKLKSKMARLLGPGTGEPERYSEMMERAIRSHNRDYGSWCNSISGCGFSYKKQFLVSTSIRIPEETFHRNCYCTITVHFVVQSLNSPFFPG